eukprot:scaffold36690_cov60-Phaeocystis_antarctica.AAC.2
MKVVGLFTSVASKMPFISTSRVRRSSELFSRLRSLRVRSSVVCLSCSSRTLWISAWMASNFLFASISPGFGGLKKECPSRSCRGLDRLVGSIDSSCDSRLFAAGSLTVERLSRRFGSSQSKMSPMPVPDTKSSSRVTGTRFFPVRSKYSITPSDHMSSDAEAGSSSYGRPSLIGLPSVSVRKVFTTYCLPCFEFLGCTLFHSSGSLSLITSQYLSNWLRSSSLSWCSASGGSTPDENLAHAKLSSVSARPKMVAKASKSMSRSLPSMMERTRLRVCDTQCGCGCGCGSGYGWGVAVVWAVL